MGPWKGLKRISLYPGPFINAILFVIEYNPRQALSCCIIQGLLPCSRLQIAVNGTESTCAPCSGPNDTCNTTKTPEHIEKGTCLVIRSSWKQQSCKAKKMQMIKLLTYMAFLNIDMTNIQTNHLSFAIKLQSRFILSNLRRCCSHPDIAINIIIVLSWSPFPRGAPSPNWGLQHRKKCNVAAVLEAPTVCF